jgi:dTDP-4-amino-4,6-dideoxygalactose transaminase
MSSFSLPALLGGPPVRPQGPPDWPPADDAVGQALQAAFRDGSWGKYHGAHGEALTRRLSEYHEVEFVLLCGSGTFAVELALRALKIGPGDEVILSAYDYGGNFLNVHAVGAIPVLVDVDADNWNLNPQHVAEAISPATRAIVVSHLHGGLVPMSEIMAIAQLLGLRVIEDAAQMPGARVEGRLAGTWGDVGVLSFGGSKLLSAGRGGAILTRHADVHQRARLWQNRGNVVNPLSELQASVLLPQLARLNDRNAQRSAAVGYLVERLRDVTGLRLFSNRASDSQPGYYKVGWQYDAEQFGLPRERFVAAVRAEGIALDEGFRALHVGRSPSRFRSGGDLPEADRAHRGCVVLHHPVLLGTQDDLDEVVRAIRKVQAHVEQLR